MKKTNFDKKKLLIVLLCLITATAVGVSIWAVWFREKTQPVLIHDYAPQQTEQNAEPIDNDDGEKLDAPEGGGAISINYSKEATIDLSDKKVTLYFANPSQSTQDVVLQLMLQNTVVVQSGRIVPGNQVNTLNLHDDTSEKLAGGSYDGKLVVLSYNQESGEKAMINTEIPITVMVTD